MRVATSYKEVLLSLDNHKIESVVVLWLCFQVYDTEEDMLEDLEAGNIHNREGRKTVVIIRYEGPKG